MPEQAVDKSLQMRLQEQFNTRAISVQVLPFNTFNEKGEQIEAQQLIVLDAEDRFMFVIGYAVADEYIFDGYINYEKIYKDYILTEKQWEAAKSESPEAENQKPEEPSIRRVNETTGETTLIKA